MLVLIFLPFRCLFVGLGFEIESCGVDAVAQARFILRAVVKDVAQVTATFGADRFDAVHAMTGVCVDLDVAFADDIPEARPTGTGMKFGPGGKQPVPAGSADIGAVVFGVDILARERPFRSRLAQDVILLISELFTPFLI